MLNYQEKTDKKLEIANFKSMYWKKKWWFFLFWRGNEIIFRR